MEASSRFDMGTYSGRACHFFDVIGDIRTLLATKAEIDQHRASLDAWTNGTSELEDAQLWHARKVVQATCHPTGEIIPAPLRFSAFAPANLVICAGMLRPNPTLLISAFWQWVNQSYNALVNHANSGAGDNDASRGTFLSAYAAGTGSAVALCVGLQEGARRLSSGSPRIASIVRLTVPMLSVSVAANVNLLLVRRSELVQGIEVSTASGEVLGVSQLAAQRALLECALTRVLWTFLLLTATPLCASGAFSMLPPRLAHTAAARSAVELGVSFGVIWMSVPLAIATFPQRESMGLEELEEDIQRRFEQLQQGHGAERRGFFNKGL